MTNRCIRNNLWGLGFSGAIGLVALVGCSDSSGSSSDGAAGSSGETGAGGAGTGGSGAGGTDGGSSGGTAGSGTGGSGGTSTGGGAGMGTGGASTGGSAGTGTGGAGTGGSAGTGTGGAGGNLGGSAGMSMGGAGGVGEPDQAVCTRSCTANSDCFSGQGWRCDFTIGQCRRFRCGSDSTCQALAGGNSCVTIQGGNVCRDGCSDDNDCPGRCIPDDNGKLYCDGCENVNCSAEQTGSVCAPSNGLCACTASDCGTLAGFSCQPIPMGAGGAGGTAGAAGASGAAGGP